MSDSNSISANPDETRAVIEHQVQILQRLNDEAVRIARLQAITISALITAVSVAIGANVIEAGLFWPPNTVAEGIGILPLFGALTAWVSEIRIVSRIKKEPRIGATTENNNELNSVENSHIDCIKKNEQLIETNRLEVETTAAIAPLVCTISAEPPNLTRFTLGPGHHFQLVSQLELRI